MKKIIAIILLAATTIITAQSNGTIQGIVFDKEMNNEPLAFANVSIKNAKISATTDFDGTHTFNVDPGTYTLVFSFPGYQKIEMPNIIVKEGEITTLKDVHLGALQLSLLKETIAKASTKKESVQKKITL